MRMRKIKKNWRKNENPRNDTESQFQETPRNLKETKENWRKIENQKKKNPTSRRMPMNMWEINKNWRATGKPRKDKELKFQENAKEHEADKEKQESE